MSTTPVSPAQPASPFLFQAHKLAHALWAVLNDAGSGSTAGAANAALAVFDAALGADRFELITADNVATRDDSIAVAAYDHLTGLTWQIKSSDQRYTNDGDADEYAKGLTTLGYTDWRVPTELELLSIRDPNACNPAVLEPFRKGVRPVWHWSSSPDPESAGCARDVSFSSGNSGIDYRNGVQRVLACRGGLGAVGGVSPGQ